jgi:hypothetical protein
MPFEARGDVKVFTYGLTAKAIVFVKFTVRQKLLLTGKKWFWKNC